MRMGIGSRLGCGEVNKLKISGTCLVVISFKDDIVGCPAMKSLMVISGDFKLPCSGTALEE